MPISISNITGTFSNNEVRYDGIGLNINAVGYAANSNLLHLQRDDETKFKVDLNGNVYVTGSLVVTGNVVANGIGGNGSGNGVVQVNSGNGLSGGPITDTGTLSVLANTGIIANSSGVFFDTSTLSGYQTTAGLTANVATRTANNTSFVGSVTAANVVSNAQLQGNLSSYALTSSLSAYQTTAGLSANVATLTANNTSFVGSVSAANVVSNSQLSSNLANYALLSRITVNPKDYGAVGDGSTNDRVAIAAADTAAVARGAVLEFSDGTYAISSNITIASPLRLNGAKLKPASGVTVTLNGQIDANDQQIFDVSAGGTIAGNGADKNTVYMSWWGGVGNGSTDNQPYLAAAIAYLKQRTLAGTYGGTLQLGIGKFVFNSGVTIDFSGITIRGVNNEDTVILKNGTFDLFTVNGAVDGSLASYGVCFEHLYIQSVSSKPTAGKMIYFHKAQEFSVRYCKFLYPYRAIDCFACGGPLVKAIEHNSFVSPSTLPSESGSALIALNGEASPSDGGTGLNERFFIHDNTGGGIGIQYGLYATGIDTIKLTGNHLHGAETAQLYIDGSLVNCYNVQSQGNTWEGLSGYAAYAVFIKAGSNIMNSFAFTNDQLLNGTTSQVWLEGAELNAVSFNGCHFMQGNADVFTADGGSQIKVVDCEFTDGNISGGSNKSWIKIGNGSTGPTNVLIAHNTFRRKYFTTYTVEYGIYSQNASELVIVGNQFHSGAAVTELNAADDQFSKYNILSSNVGIGTASPDYFVHASKSSNGIIRSVIGNPNTGSGAYAISSVLSSAGFLNSQIGTGGDATIYNTAANYLFVYTLQPAPLYLGSNNVIRATIDAGGNVGIGNTTPAHQFSLGSGYFAANSTRVVIANTVGLLANGSIGSAGQMLTSNATTIYWSTPTTGTVTSVGSGNGLTGGAITTTGSLAVLANNGIIANSSGVFAVGNTGLVTNSTGVHVNANNGIVANSTGTFVRANNGLTANSTGLWAFGNTGLVVNATGIHVNATYIGTISANNSSFLGGVVAASYVQNTDSRVLSGNINFTATNTYFTSGWFVSTINATSIGIAANTTTISIGNSSVVATINSTAYSGSANNSSFLGGTAAASFVQNTDSRTLSGNLTFTGANVSFSSLYAGNTTANVSANSTALVVANSIGSSSIVPGTIQTVRSVDASIRSFINNSNNGVSAYAIQTVRGNAGDLNMQMQSNGGAATIYNTSANYLYVYTLQPAPLYLGTNNAIRVTIDDGGNVAIASNTLTLGTSSVAANGYSKLPNGLLMQWGWVDSNTTVGNITFPTAFSSLYSMQVTANTATGYNSTYLPLVIASNTTTANVRTGNTTTKTVWWQAIGT